MYQEYLDMLFSRPIADLA